MFIDTHAHLNPEGPRPFSGKGGAYGASFNAFMLVDTHAHVNFNAYRLDAEEVIRRSLENDVWLINIGTNYETSKKAVEIAEKYPQGVYASVGLHPINLETGLVKIKTDENEGGRLEKEFDYEKYKELTKSQKVIAIGEIGLDYYYRPKTKKKLGEFKQKQKELFLKELKLARDLKLPIILHCRLAQDDLITILNNLYHNFYDRRNCGMSTFGVVHCFTGNWEQAKKYLEMGFCLGFNGIIFKLKFDETSSHLSSRTASPCSPLDEVIAKTSLDRILIETDCPYLTPPNFPTERNNPLGVKYVAEKIAEIKNISLKEIAKIATENAKRLFNV